MRWRWPRRTETLNVPAALFRKWMEEEQAEIDARKAALAAQAKVLRMPEPAARPWRLPFLVPLRRRA